MLSSVVVLAMIQAASPPASAPPEDAIGAYTLCVARSAEVRSGDSNDFSAEESAVFCDKLLGPAVDLMLLAASGNPEGAKPRIAALLELQARREALRRRSLIKSYQVDKH